MKGRKLLRHLRQHDCELLRGGAKHSWWHNPAQKRRATIPRHTKIVDVLAKNICRDLGVPFPK